MNFDDKVILAIEHNIMSRYIYDKFLSDDINRYGELFNDYKFLSEKMIETIDTYVEEVYEIESNDLRISSLIGTYQFEIASVSSLKEIKRLVNNMLYDSHFRECNFYKVLNRDNVINNLLEQ